MSDINNKLVSPGYAVWHDEDGGFTGNSPVAIEPNMPTPWPKRLSTWEAKRLVVNLTTVIEEAEREKPLERGDIVDASLDPEPPVGTFLRSTLNRDFFIHRTAEGWVTSVDPEEIPKTWSFDSEYEVIFAGGDNT